MDLNPGVEKVFAALSSQQDLRDGAATTSLSSGITLFQNKKYKEAAAAFRMATAYKPDYIDAYNFMASAYLQSGKNKEAIDAYKISLQLDKSQDEIHVNLANIYIAEKRNNEAEKELKVAANLNPQSSLAPYTLGHLYLQTNRPKDAVDQFKKVISLEPKNGNGQYALGLAYNRLGQYDDAVKELKQAVTLKKDFALANYELGNAYAGQGQMEQAREQVAVLKKINTSQSNTLAKDLDKSISQPKIYSFNDANSSFGPYSTFGAATSLIILGLAAPSSSKDFTMQFQFDSGMDVGSVMTLSNWSISKASGGPGGIYNNGISLHQGDQISVSPVPKSVTFDPETSQATVTFSITQNEAGTGVIDPSHLVFKFSGTDVNGKQMDPNADEYDGFAGEPF
ncbi:MAG: hypothetical protein FD174_2080 [Geobacteraceae bacterium]|nr:MAG: hypothetical protein FD174_2080 [Geobacteraceae bacterium]